MKWQFFLNQGKKMNKNFVFLGFLILLMPGVMSPMKRVTMCKSYSIQGKDGVKRYDTAEAETKNVIAKVIVDPQPDKKLKQVIIVDEGSPDFFGDDIILDPVLGCLDLSPKQNLGVQSRLKLTALAYYLKTNTQKKSSYICMVPEQDEIGTFLNGFVLGSTYKQYEWFNLVLNVKVPSPHGKSKSALPSFTNEPQKVD